MAFCEYWLNLLILKAFSIHRTMYYDVLCCIGRVNLLILNDDSGHRAVSLTCDHHYEHYQSAGVVWLLTVRGRNPWTNALHRR